MIASLALLIIFVLYTCPAVQTFSGDWILEPRCEADLSRGSTAIVFVALVAILYATYLDISRAVAIGTQECEREMEVAKME